MFRSLLGFDEARKKIEGVLSPQPLGVDEVPLQKAVGCVLAEDLTSSIDVPPFHRSTVDGFAVRAEDTFGAEEEDPVILSLAGCVNVGEMPSLTLGNGEAAEIVTGAPLPINADAVVMLEYTSQKDERLFVFRPVTKNENMMFLGSDILKGEIVLHHGAVLSSRELGVLAALGQTHARVFRQPKVAIISTGSEIVELGTALPPGKIYDINTYTLAAAVLENGGEPIIFGIVKDDDAELLKSSLKQAIGEADIVLTSGGVSVGPKDIIPKIIDQLGKPGLVVHGVAVKPGKPIAVAVIGKKPVFALPGHPTSSLLMFMLVVRPTLLKMAGKQGEPMTAVKAIVTEKIFSARGRRTFVTVTLHKDKIGRWLASPVFSGQSGAITTLAKADGFIELKETQQFLEAKEEALVSLF